MSTPHGFLADLLVRAGIVSGADIAAAAEFQSKHVGASLGRALAGLGLAYESVVADAIAAGMRLEHFSGEPVVAADVAALVPADFCRKRRVLPLGMEGRRLRVALTDPSDYSVLQDIEFRIGKKVVPVVVTQTWIEKALAIVFPEAPVNPYDMLAAANPAGEVERTGEHEYEVMDPAKLAESTELPPIVRLVNLILSDAATVGASDVHIEPQESVLQVRQRVDGLLREVLTIPLHLRDQTISRFKIISGMDIAERRKPQDGRSRLRFDGKRIDLRVSTLPTQFGEKVVIRLLNADRAIMPLDGLGLDGRNLHLMRSFLTRPQGMILVTGPTGSGKTSTLYAALNSVKSPTNNIITLEDPIEFQLPGVNQTQINVKAGVTFAEGLRSILRQDPNVILVGEIRDQETADIALKAAQTGHLLLSTLHTNDSPATITRLLDLGIQPFLVASSLIGIVAQRLVRRPCPSCAVPRQPSAEAIEAVGGGSRLPSAARWLAGQGCDKCGQSGFKGRLAIHEVLEVTDEVRELIAARAPEHALRKAARNAGMRTMLEDGVDKAARGLTTLEELLRVVPRVEAEQSAPQGQTIASVVVQTPAPPPTPAPAPSPAPTPAPAAAAGPASAAGRRVLIVEDSPTIQSVVKYFLELEGFEVLVADDGVKGLETALAQIPDVIVSDLNMPGMSGVEMIKALRADDRTRDVRVLMLTSESSIEAETSGLAAGADDYVLKPVEPKRLAARLNALLARARGRQLAAAS